MLRRAAAWAAGVLLGLTVLYLVVANVFLRTQLLRKVMNGSPDDIWADYTSAYSIFPGRIHVEGLRLRGSDHSVEWILGLDRADFHVWPLDAFKRRFHASHIRADGVSFRIRMKMDREDVTAKVAAALPPVPGFSDPPYKSLTPPPPPPTDANYHLVSIQLDDVVASHVREIWTHTVRFTGDLDVTGRWLFRPLRWLDVGPANVDVRTMNVSYGADETLARDLRGNIALQIHPFDVRIPQGADILDYVSVRTDLAGAADGTNLLDVMASDVPVKLVRGDAAIQAAMNVSHGRVLPPTRVLASLENPEVDVAGLVLRAWTDAELLVDEANGAPMAHLALGVNAPRLTKGNDELARASSLAVTVNDPSVQLARLSLEQATFVADVDGLAAESVPATRKLLLERTKVDLRSAHLAAQAHVEGRMDGTDASGHLAFDVRDVAAARETDEVRTNAQGNVRVRALSLREGHADLAGSDVTLTGTIAKVRGLEATAASLYAKASRATLGQGDPDVRVDVDAPSIRSADLRPLNHLLPPSNPLTVLRGYGRVGLHGTVDVGEKTAIGSVSAAADDAAIQVGNAMVEGNATVRVERAQVDWGRGEARAHGAEATLTNVVVKHGSKMKLVATASRIAATTHEAVLGKAGPSGTIALDLARADVPDLPGLAQIVGLPSALKVERGRGAVTLHAEASLASRTLRGEANVWTEGMHVKVGSEAFATNIAIAVAARPSNVHAGTTDFSGSSLAATSDAAHGEEGWWARATASSGSMTVAKGVSLLADLKLEAKDAAPAQAMVATLTGIPRWLVEAAPMSHLTARATLATSPSSLDIRGLQADGGPTSVRLEFARRGGDKQGGVLVTVGDLQLGVNLGGTGPGLVLFGAKPWFLRKAVAMESNPSLVLHRD